VAFKISFVVSPIYALINFWSFPPLLDFQHQLTFFYSTLIHIYIWEISKAKFLECLKAPLIHRQTYFLISRGGIGFFNVEVIAPIMYLGKWGALMIASKFLQVKHPFLLRATRLIIHVHFHSRFTLGGFMTFYFQLLMFTSFRIDYVRRKKQIVFKITLWKVCMNIFFPTSL
jgi:hypothetical protein